MLYCERPSSRNHWIPYKGKHGYSYLRCDFFNYPNICNSFPERRYSYHNMVFENTEAKNIQFHYIRLLQSIVDLANGVLFMPLVTFRFANEAVGGTSCAVAIFLKKFGMLIFFYTLTTLSVMNFDRYLGTVHPLYHRRVLTNTKLLAYVVSTCSVQTIIYGFSSVNP